MMANHTFLRVDVSSRGCQEQERRLLERLAEQRRGLAAGAEGRVLGDGAKTRQEDKYGQRKTYKTAIATAVGSVYIGPAWRSGERPTHLDKPLCSGCPERVIWQLGLKSAGSPRRMAPNRRLIAELLLGIFYFPLTLFDNLSGGVYS